MARSTRQRSGRTRRRRRVSFSGQNLELEEIGRYHADIDNSLRRYFSWENATTEARFVGYTRNDLERELASTLAEVEHNSSMSILASLEATFRVDYLQRNYKRKRDTLSRQLRAVYERKAEHASLEDEILPTWRRCAPRYGQVFSDLAGAFKYRHWLAHGRYWTPIFGGRYAYQELFQLAGEIFDEFSFELA